MSNTAQTSSLDGSDLEKLSDRDRADLQQFLSNERQRSQIQSQTHALTHVCWNKCVTGGIRSAKLDRSEEACLANCVDRFLDMSFLTMKHLQTMRSS